MEAEPSLTVGLVPRWERGHPLSAEAGGSPPLNDIPRRGRAAALVLLSPRFAFSVELFDGAKLGQHGARL